MTKGELGQVFSCWSNVSQLHSSKIMTIQQGESRYLNPVSGPRGFPTELTPRGKPCCIVRIFEECKI